MATRVEDSMSLVFEFVLLNPDTGKNFTKKVTLNGINTGLTDAQYLQVAQKIGRLLKNPAAAYGLVTRDYIVPGSQG